MPSNGEGDTTGLVKCLWSSRHTHMDFDEIHIMNPAEIPILYNTCSSDFGRPCCRKIDRHVRPQQYCTFNIPKALIGCSNDVYRIVEGCYVVVKLSNVMSVDIVRLRYARNNSNRGYFH